MLKKKSNKMTTNIVTTYLDSVQLYYHLEH